MANIIEGLGLVSFFLLPLIVAVSAVYYICTKTKVAQLIDKVFQIIDEEYE